MGFVLIRRRKYQLQLVVPSISAELEASSWTWERPLEAGARVQMNTYVQLRVNRDVLTCPGCYSQVPNLDQLALPGHGWVAW